MNFRISQVESIDFGNGNMHTVSPWSNDKLNIKTEKLQASKDGDKNPAIIW